MYMIAKGQFFGDYIYSSLRSFRRLSSRIADFSD